MTEKRLRFYQQYSREIVSLIVPILTAVIAYLPRARVKLIWSDHYSRTMLSEEFEQVEVGPPRRRQLLTRTASLNKYNQLVMMSELNKRGLSYEETIRFGGAVRGKVFGDMSDLLATAELTLEKLEALSKSLGKDGKGE